MSADTTPADCTANAILEVVAAERARLINVVSTVRCIRFSEESGELAGALALVEEELERILEALEGPALERAAAGATMEVPS